MSKQVVGQDDNSDVYMYVMIIGTCLLLILATGFIMHNNKHMTTLITEHNLMELERCAILDCHMTLTGHLQCKTLTVEDVVTDNVILINDSQWNIQRGLSKTEV